ncbi:hypothetical protein [Falsihalocynthiibacter arcticus]|uniref:Uncharacterized protein n=1 Tax=Falsihalocynthiibacter arcticus TaxID=1579316 RepID=A0A126V057_9RHOB|nr:hypothetical protein [Falsihalocynthiibacter arcticus]AML51712.1 hypothetical protein RC74_10960 [Falsihalocynthiibacter arcticus]
MTYGKTAIRGVAALALSISTATAEPLPCQGQYQAISGDVIMSASGIIQIDPCNRNEGTVDLPYDGCDRIVIAGQGVRMPIVRTATSGWSSTLKGGSGMTVQRGIKLTLVAATEHQPVDCERQYLARENATAQAFLASPGPTPPTPEFTPSGYFRAAKLDNNFIDETHNTNSLHLRFLQGIGNAILPATRAATLFREVCRAEEGTLDPPRRMLDFKISEVEGTDDTALAAAMQDGAAQLAEDGVTVGPLSDGKAL